MRELNVELYGSLIGILTQKGRSVEFSIQPEVLRKYQLSSTIMSIAVPLNLRYTNAQKKRCANFFLELLPEGRNLEWIEQTLTRNEQTPFDILRRYGRDIAGALSIYDPADPARDIPPVCEPVSTQAIRYLLEHMPRAPLANAPDSGRSSLGGVQGKILLAKIGDQWQRVHHGYPSTHILKPVVPEFPTMIYDEAFCMQMAYHAGLTAYPVWIEDFDGVDALVIERYDRSSVAGEDRLHQEDCNQALGARGNEKYQEYGGKVTAKRIAQTIARYASEDDVKRFASYLLFAIAIGNMDMHAKNISLLHYPNDTITLAPIYDQLPHRHLNNDGKMALAIDGEYTHASLSLAEIVRELLSWRCSSFINEEETLAFIKSRLDAYMDALWHTKVNKNAYPELTNEISTFITNLLAGKKVGSI